MYNIYDVVYDVKRNFGSQGNRSLQKGEAEVTSVLKKLENDVLLSWNSVPSFFYTVIAFCRTLTLSWNNDFLSPISVGS